MVLQSIVTVVPVLHVPVDPVLTMIGLENIHWSVYATHGLIVNQPLLLLLYDPKEGMIDRDCPPIV
ncbi:hypothetical protein KAZ93_01080 [Patescibacteria group bacterium]|nr:hypothetical protein [Patescibacteria group bacterium]